MTEEQKDKIVQTVGEWKFCHQMMDVFEKAIDIFEKSGYYRDNPEIRETVETFDKWDNLRLQKEKELLDLL